MSLIKAGEEIGWLKKKELQSKALHDYEEIADRIEILEFASFVKRGKEYFEQLDKLSKPHVLEALELHHGEVSAFGTEFKLISPELPRIDEEADHYISHFKQKITERRELLKTALKYFMKTGKKYVDPDSGEEIEVKVKGGTADYYTGKW